jgi:glucokinase
MQEWQKVAIGIDLGGTRIKGVAIDESGVVLYRHYQPTNDGDDSNWKAGVAEAVFEIQNKIEEKGYIIGISAPGLPNEDNSAIAYMPGRLQGLENFVWTNFLKSQTLCFKRCHCGHDVRSPVWCSKRKEKRGYADIGHWSWRCYPD